jgi:hypothetical protein
MQYQSCRRSRPPRPTIHTLLYTGPLSPDVSPSTTCPATDICLSVASRASTRQLVTLISGWSAIDTYHWKPSVSLDSIPLLQVRTPKGRDSPDRYDNHRGTFIPSFATVVKSPFASSKVSWITKLVDTPPPVKSIQRSMR